MNTHEGRYELKRLSGMEWVIADHHYGDDDPRHIIAQIFEVDTYECEVVWLRDLPFRTVYGSPLDVLADLNAASSRHTKPIQIPHLPPPDGAAGGSSHPTLPA